MSQEIVPPMDHILSLGPQKPLGYLPLNTIEMCGYNPSNLVLELSQRGFLADIYPFEVCSVFSGALYVCAPEWLKRHLAINEGVLSLYGWPGTPEEFMFRVAIERVCQTQNPDLYAVIGQAFGDPRFPPPGAGSLGS